MGFTTLAAKRRSFPEPLDKLGALQTRAYLSKGNAPKARCLQVLLLQSTKKGDHLILGSDFYLSGSTEHHLGSELVNPHIKVRHTEETDASDWGCRVLKYLTACASELEWH